MIKPINGLEGANQSGIASRNGRTSRLRVRELAFATGKSVERPVPKAFGIPGTTFKELIVFIRLKFNISSAGRVLDLRPTSCA
jgi:hypothetical protein